MEKLKSFDLFESKINNNDLEFTIKHMINNCREKSSPDLKGILLLFDLIPNEILKHKDYLFNNIFPLFSNIKKYSNYNVDDIYKLIKILLDNGIDIDKKDNDGYTLLETSLTINDEKIFRLILDHNPRCFSSEVSEDIFAAAIDHPNLSFNLLDIIQNVYPHLYKKYLSQKKSKKFNL